MLKLFAGLALACFAAPAFADTAPVPVAPSAPAACATQSADALLAAAKKAGVTISSDFTVKGADGLDRIIVVSDTQFIWMFWISKGCIVGSPVPIDHVEGAVVAPVPAPSIPDVGT